MDSTSDFPRNVAISRTPRSGACQAWGSLCPKYVPGTLLNFDRGQGDKIKLFENDGTTPIANPITNGRIDIKSAFGEMAVHVANSSEVIFATNSPDLTGLLGPGLSDNDFIV